MQCNVVMEDPRDGNLWNTGVIRANIGGSMDESRFGSGGLGGPSQAGIRTKVAFHALSQPFGRCG